jgi:hypothetical protein
MILSRDKQPPDLLGDRSIDADTSHGRLGSAGVNDGEEDQEN